MEQQWGERRMESGVGLPVPISLAGVMLEVLPAVARNKLRKRGKQRVDMPRARVVTTMRRTAMGERWLPPI